MKEIEKRDSVLTSKQQIERLLRPGSSYFNLNPFEGNHLSLIKIQHLQLNNPFIVLQLEPETPVDQIKKKYRSLSILVHPDKNVEEMRDRAQQAFEVVNKAWKVLENEVTRKKCLEVYEEAKDRTDLMVTF